MGCRAGVAIAIAVASALHTGIGYASSIGVFFASDGSDCDGTASSGVPFTVYIGAVLGGDAAANGISGVEFRMDGADLAWARTVIPSPAAGLTLGNPVLGGCIMTFPSCQPGPFVLLYTVQFVAAAPIASTRFIIEHDRSFDNIFLCPLLIRCDSPVFTKMCVSGGQAFLNDPTRACTVTINRQSWSTVKSLFQ